MLPAWFETYGALIACTFWLFFVWVSYAQFARYRAKRTHCLASQLHAFRILWMKRVMRRDNRVTDSSLLASLERNASFFANITVLVMAGIVTALGSAGQATNLLNSLPFSTPASPHDAEVKLMLLFVIFAYAFFSFTWAMRKYGFCAVLVGAFPLVEENVEQSVRDSFAINTARVIDQAGHSYNAGLRGYYFAMSFLAWLVSPVLFALSVLLVVAVLYHREFHSKALKTLVQVTEDSNQITLREDQ
ncbi:DUF599 domain-containing protein [Simiduia curdlanivorans]|uniref:DUF599 domain-containing protein n=1 Tax=Simiduia curdlanivorans TaxID=1492769 RepID=A0ABV8V1V7_9GAMM|nr:DUF599 domain-containing protein [Simiduia curdlanivorans]MDN3640101.1 DUF599 domain-containing protein [Simiduia curdlanivorans]